METKTGLSHGLAEAVRRLFSDTSFKDEALADPELAFAHYSLDAEERQALNSLMGNLNSRGSMFVKKPTRFEWWGG